MMKMLEHKVAVVTGGARGIGRATALTFAAHGAKVVVSTANNVAGGEETVRLIREAGGEAIFTLCDISDEAAVEAMVQRTLDQYGRLDCAFNNAAQPHDKVLLADLDTAQWRRTLDVVLTGTWLCMKHEIRAMAGHAGSIVNVASTTGMMGFPRSGGYSAAKAGLLNLTRTAAKEYGPDGIRVNALSPGPINTDMVANAIAANPALAEGLKKMLPLGRIGEAEEVAALALWLCSDQSAFVSGANYVIDGAQTA
jgi:NAD(P)-dependent dehydrogenase (short-subunit alcohol dehydrogenase family)